MVGGDLPRAEETRTVTKYMRTRDVGSPPAAESDQTGFGHVRLVRVAYGDLSFINFGVNGKVRVAALI